MVTYGFLGAGGIMGRGMAMNLVKKGFDVTVRILCLQFLHLSFGELVALM